jgi:amino acid transporter
MGDSVSPTRDAKDAALLEELGYHPELRREFGFFHAFALSFSDMSLIVGFYGSFALAFAAAGPSFLWGCIVVAIGAILISLVLGEVSSHWPLEGGIYQWTLEQTGPKPAWFSSWAYWWTSVFAIPACAYPAASFILSGLGVAAPTKLQTIGLAILIVAVGVAINVFTQAIMKWFFSIVLVAELGTTIVLGVVFFVAYRTQPWSVLFHSFNTAHNSGINWLLVGWMGAVAFMGWNFLAFEAAGSIGEEVHDAARNVPRAIVGVCVLICGLVIFVTLAFILATPDIGKAMSGNVADPVMETISYHLGAGFVKPVLLLISLGFIGSMVANNTFGSRLLYAFSRDNMIPGSKAFVVLSKTRKLPYVAVIFTAAAAVVVLLINIPLEKVYATLISVAVLSWYVSYAFPVFSQLILHAQKRYRPAAFNLGRASYLVTILASLWIVIEIINVCWPRSPSLSWYQNWGVLVVGVGVAVAGVIVYLLAPRHEGQLGAVPSGVRAHGLPASVEGVAEDKAFTESPH